MDGDEKGWRGYGSSFQSVVKERQRGWGSVAAYKFAGVFLEGTDSLPSWECMQAVIGGAKS